MTQLEDHNIFRYGVLYGSRMPWMMSRAQILAKIALANRTHQPPRNVAIELYSTFDKVADAWDQYNTICTFRLNGGSDSILKSDKMLNYGRLFEDA